VIHVPAANKLTADAWVAAGPRLVIVTLEPAATHASAVEHPTRIIANAGNHLYRRFTVTTSSPTIRSVTCGSGPSGGA
jgi:hypothetical protein